MHPLEGLPLVFAAHGLTPPAAFDIALTCHPIVQPDGRIQAVETVAGPTPSMGAVRRARRAWPARELFVSADLRNAVRSLLTDGAVRRMTVNHA
ncbi:hypothetical protein [Rhodococcus opacus]|uniref:hypothetical protein n=1 Tax=Rhodococcus opacus TaxID=37919 RepID=UPI0024BB2689|nr:hypothetical protein [Rhodococcus opacus]MDJ0420315.1 hypothetical protein [Rhodococcus opacus]